MFGKRLRAIRSFERYNKSKDEGISVKFGKRNHWRYAFRLGGSLFIANSMPAYSCEVSFEVVRALNFGEVIAPSSFGTSGWARVDLDGSVTLSSYSLNPNLDGAVGTVELGRLKISVEDAVKGSEIEVEIDATLPSFRVFPETTITYKLPDEATSGEFYLDYGGQFFFENEVRGSLLGDLFTLSRCKS